MIDGENANSRISPEIRGLDSMKENTLTDRFKMVKNFDLNLLTTFEAVLFIAAGLKLQMHWASPLQLSARRSGVYVFIIMMRCLSGTGRRWHRLPSRLEYMKGWRKLMTT